MLPVVARIAGAVVPWVSRTKLIRPLVGRQGFLGVGKALGGISGPPGRFLLGGLRIPSEIKLLGPGTVSTVTSSGRLLALKSFTARITHIARNIIKKTPATVLSTLPKVKTFVKSGKFRKICDGIFLAWMFADILNIFDKDGDLDNVEQSKVDDLLLQLIPATFSAQLSPLQRTICEYLVYNEDKCDYRTLINRIHSAVITTSELVDPEISSESFYVFKLADELSNYPASYLDDVINSKAFKKYFREFLEDAADLSGDKELSEFVDDLFDHIDLKNMSVETKRNLVLIYLLATV